MSKIGITTDCVCDLPAEYFEIHDVGIVYFYITTDTGRFKDGYEIDSRNLIEYLEDGGQKAETKAPEPMEYKLFFEEKLKKYDEIIHISISDKISLSYKNAMAALETLGADKARVKVVDSMHLSTGIGHIVIKAVEMRDSGYSAEKIIEGAKKTRDLVSTTFIAKNADYLYRNGKTSKFVKDICSTLMLHPVLTMKEGHITLKTLRIGDYEKAVKRYIKSELSHNKKINKRRLFITHVGYGIEGISEIKNEVKKLCDFDEIIVTTASATISSNCGAGTIGVLFVKEN